MIAERPSVCPLDCPDTCSLIVTVEDDRHPGLGPRAKRRGRLLRPGTLRESCAREVRGGAPSTHDGQGYVHGYLLLGTRARYLEEHSGETERLLKALDRGRDYAAAHPDAVTRFAHDMFGADPAAVAADYALVEHLLGVGPAARTSA
jgi:hypothetical protein